MQLNKTTSSLPSNNKPNILIVDDSKDMLVYIMALLQNYETNSAKNGLEALEIIKSNKIDLLITDYRMPKMDGLQLVKEVKRLKYEFPIIVITVLNSKEKKLEMFRLGIDNYIYKPFFKEELINIIDRALVYHKTLINEKDVSENDKIDSDEFKQKLESILYNNVNNFDFSNSDIANEFNISTKTLSRRTKAIYGQTPNQLMIECRLLIAQEIINQNPEFSISQIAKKVGLKNTSYLKKRLSDRFK